MFITVKLVSTSITSIYLHVWWYIRFILSVKFGHIIQSLVIDIVYPSTSITLSSFNPWPPFYLLFPWVLLLWIPSIDKIRWYFVFFWLISLSRIFFFLFVKSRVEHSSEDRHLGGFHVIISTGEPWINSHWACGPLLVCTEPAQTKQKSTVWWFGEHLRKLAREPYLKSCYYISVEILDGASWQVEAGQENFQEGGVFFLTHRTWRWQLSSVPHRPAFPKLCSECFGRKYSSRLHN